MIKKKAFTLVELLLVIIIASLIMTILFTILTTMPRVKNQNDAKMTLIEQTNGVIEKLNLIIQGYEIDYEEYFNRKQVGCVGGNNTLFSRNIEIWTGHCTDNTYYGNRNSWDVTKPNINKIYFCSDANNHPNNLDVCKEGNKKWIQSYGQYQQSFWNVGIDTDNSYIPWLFGFPEVGDSDDRDLWTGPIAIGDPNNTQELYLISSDQTKRILIRRKFVAKRADSLWNMRDQYTLQILKLRGFDAGSHHDFDFNNEDAHGIFDGKIDTWACDYAEGFVCKGDAVNTTLYSWYHLPADYDDGRANLLNDNISIDARNIKIVPIKKPEYARAEEYMQINPYIKLSLSTSLTPHIWGNKLAGGITGANIASFSYTLQTLFNTKTFYSK